MDQGKNAMERYTIRGKDGTENVSERGLTSYHEEKKHYELREGVAEEDGRKSSLGTEILFRSENAPRLVRACSREEKMSKGKTTIL